MTVLVTGAAGYIGGMLIDELLRSDSATCVVGVDLKPRPKRLEAETKVRWIKADISDDTWIDELGEEAIETVIHCAYQIRELYGRAARLQQRWNLDGAQKVFEFALTQPSVRRLVQLSTVTAYGPAAENSLERPFTEADPLREDTYLYGRQKRQVEELLSRSYRRCQTPKHVVILRLASVSGPRGRFGLGRYGLLSTIAGKLPCFVCGRSDWGRQFLHEDDLVAVLITLITAAPKTGIEIFNVAPQDFLDAGAIGKLFGKRIVVLPPAYLSALFWLGWHGTRGRLPTPGGAWKVLSYPTRVDGSRLTQAYGHNYRYSAAQALMGLEGRFAGKSDLKPNLAPDHELDGQTDCARTP